MNLLCRGSTSSDVHTKIREYGRVDDHLRRHPDNPRYDGSHFRKILSIVTILVAGLIAHSAWAQNQVASLSALQATSTATYPNGVWRIAYSSTAPAAPLFYLPESGTCSANTRVNDGGSCVNTTTGDGNSWVAQFPSAIDIREWGVSTAAADNTTAIQGAENYGGTLIWPCGDFKFASAITLGTNTVNRGSGFCTELESTAASVDAFDCTTTGVVMENVRIVGDSKTGGYLFNFDGCNISTLRNFQMYGWYYGVGYTGAAATAQHIENGQLLSPAGTSSQGVFVGSATVDGVASNIFISGTSSGAQCEVGFNIESVGDFTIDHGSTVYCSASGAGALYVTPQSGETVQALYVHHSFFDSGSGDGIRVVPNGGTVQLVKIDHTWSVSNSGNGATLEISTGTVEEIDLDDDVFSNNGSQGLLDDLTGSSALVNIRGGSAGSNSQSGLYFNSSAINFYVSNFIAGTSGEFSDNSQYGIVLAGSNDHFRIDGGSVCNNTTGSLSLGSYSGSHGVIKNVDCYNPVGASQPSVGTSPWTTTAVSHAQTAYITGGTVSGVTQGGDTVCAATNCSVQLWPNETATITYSVKPTVTLYGH